MEWEANITEATEHIPNTINNKYATLADNGEDDEDKPTGHEDEHENNNKSTGMANAGDKRTGVESDVESTGVKSERAGVTKSKNMTLIEEDISEAEENTAEGKYLLTGNTDSATGKDIEESDPQFDEVKVETEELRGKHVIHQDTQVPTANNV